MIRVLLWTVSLVSLLPAFHAQAPGSRGQRNRQVVGGRRLDHGSTPGGMSA